MKLSADTKLLMVVCGGAAMTFWIALGCAGFAVAIGDMAFALVSLVIGIACFYVLREITPDFLNSFDRDRHGPR